MRRLAYLVLQCSMMLASASCASESAREAPHSTSERISIPAANGAERTTAEHAVLSGLRRFGASGFADRFAERALERTSAGFRFPRVAESASTSWTALDVTAPAYASGPLHIAAPGPTEAWIEIAAEDLRPVAADVRGNALVFADAAEDTDVVHLLTGGEIEEIRVLRSAAAPARARYRLRAGTGVASVRAREGRIEAVDAAGTVRIASAPLYAFDARGVRREPALTVRNDRDGYAIEITLDTSGLTHPIAIDPLWSAAASMKDRRVDHTITNLVSGKVLVTGGKALGTTFLSTAEVYDPATNTWTSSTGDMAETRARHTATLLTSGKVLVVGGMAGAGVFRSTAELFDPATGSFSAAGSAPIGAANFTATLLASGKVLLAGGSASSAAAILWDAGTFTLTGSMTVGRQLHTAAKLATGNVLVAGGQNAGAPISSAEIYDAIAGTWSTTTPLNHKRFNPASLTLPSGKVMVVGGFDGAELNSAELYLTGFVTTWSDTAPMAVAREKPGAVLLPTSGAVLVAGGGFGLGAHSTAELYNPTGNLFVNAPSMTDARSTGFGLLLLAGTTDRALAVGGNTLSSAEIFTYPSAGDACTTAADCGLLGGCVDKVCCNTACTGVCQACTAAKKGSGTDGICGPIKDGTDPKLECPGKTCTGAIETNPQVCNGSGACRADGTTPCPTGIVCAGASCAGTKADGQACADKKECGSGFCVDGFCCNNACDSQCSACDVIAKPGVCTTITGKVHGSRPACAGDATTCGGTCDGVTALTCSYPPATTSCGDGCTDGKETKRTCDGKGTCVDGSSNSCGAYLCGTSKCLDACTGDAQCAKGYGCVGAKCIPVSGGKCSDDLTSSIGADGKVTPCGAFKCDNGTKLCRQICNASDDCATARVCNLTSKTCEAAVAGASDSAGGCGCRVSIDEGAPSDGMALLAMIGGLAAMARRRRGRRIENRRDA